MPVTGTSRVRVAVSSLSVFLDHRRVNLYLRVSLGWCARRTQGFIPVRVKHPYIQFAAARVTGTWFIVGVIDMREKKNPKSLVK